MNDKVLDKKKIFKLVYEILNEYKDVDASTLDDEADQLYGDLYLFLESSGME